MSMKSDSEKKYMAMLALVIIIGVFYITYLLLTTAVPEENKDAVNMALGLLFGLAGAVVGYYFGSSKSSSDKNSGNTFGPLDDTYLGDLASKTKDNITSSRNIEG